MILSPTLKLLHRAKRRQRPDRFPFVTITGARLISRLKDNEPFPINGHDRLRLLIKIVFSRILIDCGKDFGWLLLFLGTGRGSRH